ncbi:hypothetical protein ABAC460_22815 [Asticcacaulis sp. AC460]|uniref:hypothetical protein n=1 Tax=Asticcacaulis sp. AC460 TaxID=1282360 RepID=UPI0003C3F436|nr:hypothetical protein [Asticcacaulis sp. AC460]ESQ86663.1 hypothetical protein ABAC460_22815 [Asticcacaulis sp. AC460]
MKSLFSILAPVLAVGLMAQSVMAQDSKQAQFNEDYQRAAGLVDYASDEITAGNEAYENTYWGAACTRLTNGQHALVEAVKIYEVMLLSANMSANARDHISGLDQKVRDLIVNIDTKRTDSCNR